MACWQYLAVAACAFLSAHEIVVHADLPVHCVQPEVVGLWRFHVGTFHGENGPDPLCGHKAPGSQDGQHELTPPNTPSNPANGKYFLTDKFKEEYTMQVLLRDWTSRVVSVDAAGKQQFPESVDKMAGGDWTMIYDEGFHVNLGGTDGQHSFLAFSKYMLGPGDSAGSTDNMGNKKHSYCDTTLLGWYKQTDPSTGGFKRQQCWWGERIKSLHGALATLPPTFAAPPIVPPVLPLPSKNTSSASKRPKVLERFLPSSAHLASLGNRNEEPVTSVPTAALPKSSFHYLTLRGLKVGLALSLTLATVAAYQSTVKRHGKGGFNRWHAVALISFLVAFAMMCSLWHGPTSEHGSTPQSLRKSLEAVASGSPVRERQERSSVQEQLDTFSPSNLVDGLGFHTEQIIGPSRVLAVKEQLAIAKNIGKAPGELTIDDVKDGWTLSATNHHLQRTFTMNDKTLEPEGWRTLTDFDWRNVSLQLPDGKFIANFVNAVPDQGGCGSCYAVASTSMITSRLMLKYPELHEKFAESRGADRISVKQQLSCNPYNQGCGGGYPYLTSAWSHGNDIVSEKCVSQSGSGLNRTSRRHVDCGRFEGAACKERFRVENWRYLGGSLGRCGLHHLCEAAMREELYKGGPLAVSLEPAEGFGYADGVYRGTAGVEDKGMLSEVHTAKDKRNCTDTECYMWRKVDHSVLLVGWGEDVSKGKTCQPRVHRIETEATQETGCEKLQSQEDCAKNSACVFQGFPYWIIQNSYGPGFGREGYLYFGPRGQDPMRVEAMTVAADVVWVNRPRPQEAKSDLQPKQASHLATATHHRRFDA